jgi:hypothetical protein
MELSTIESVWREIGVKSYVVSRILHKDSPGKGEAENAAFLPPSTDSVGLASSGRSRINLLSDTKEWGVASPCMKLGDAHVGCAYSPWMGIS